MGINERYITARSHVGVYIRYVYGKEDIELREFNYEFVIGYEHYLKTVRACFNNTAMVCLKL
ncbi:phage integrase SAM-like domain-containing protein [Myroides odoratimimus]|uniref:phage integrase SAM-like domain-containing protein n=1 Tax=Myroides odoratimimus TaxID=76832 RepID=UPI0033076618